MNRRQKAIDLLENQLLQELTTEYQQALFNRFRLASGAGIDELLTLHAQSKAADGLVRHINNRLGAIIDDYSDTQ